MGHPENRHPHLHRHPLRLLHRLRRCLRRPLHHPWSPCSCCTELSGKRSSVAGVTSAEVSNEVSDCGKCGKVR
ncbi:unnamed protein product [Closterium sp. NIES-54]